MTNGCDDFKRSIIAGRAVAATDIFFVGGRGEQRRNFYPMGQIFGMIYKDIETSQCTSKCTYCLLAVLELKVAQRDGNSIIFSKRFNVPPFNLEAHCGSIVWYRKIEMQNINNFFFCLIAPPCNYFNILKTVSRSVRCKYII